MAAALSKSLRKLYPVVPRRFYARSPEVVARALLGKLLVRELPVGVLVGRIVEAEAYLPQDDSACHAYRGPTKRNASMFGPPGHAYVYAIHSRWCLNTVTAAAGIGCAVLLRAIEPLIGLDQMQANRGTDRGRDLCRGPARLCEALGVNKHLDGHDLTLGRDLWIATESANARKVSPPQRASRINVTRRIGVTSAEDLPLRFIVAGSEFVSGTRRQNEPSHNGSQGPE